MEKWKRTKNAVPHTYTSPPYFVCKCIPPNQYLSCNTTKQALIDPKSLIVNSWTWILLNYYLIPKSMRMLQ